MRYSQRGVDLMLKLLPQCRNQHLVKDFLRQRGFPSSARSWGDLVEDRLRPIVEDRSLSYEELVTLFNAAEEYGHQHVFLYRCPRAKVRTLANRSRVDHALSSVGLDALSNAPRLVEGTPPDRMELVDVRVSASPREPALVVKAVETRVVYEPWDRKESKTVLTKRWRRSEERCVNVAQLNADGLLEIRIASRSNTSKYRDDINAIQDLISPFLPPARFEPVRLAKAKRRMWEDRSQLAGELRHSEAVVRNSAGFAITAATGAEQDDLYEDPGSAAGLDAFSEHGAILHEKANVWFKAQSNHNPSKDIHVLVDGEPNELAITANCTRKDHEYVIKRIRRHNR